MNPSVRHDDARFLDLLRRWQSGDFTRADELELKTLTDSDDFRREAMEGFMALPEADLRERMSALQTRIRTRSGTARPMLTPRILAAAAAVVLLIAALWLVPEWNDRRSREPVAQTQSAPAENPPAPVAAPETRESDNTTAAAPPPLPTTRDASGTASAPGNAGQPEIGEPNSDAVAQQDELAAAEEKQVEQAQYNVVAPQGPNALPSVVQRSEEAMMKKPSAATAERAKAKKSEGVPRMSDSIWHETDRKPDMDAEREAAAKDALLRKSEPAGGWDAFREYLRQNARLTPEALNNNISGTVQVKFTVNANGEPQNFVTLRSLGYGCDQEAVRLIKAWEWLRGGDPDVTVDVPFVR